MEKTIDKKINTFVDYLKGIGIILVLMGHCIQYGSGKSFLENGEYLNNIVMKVIYSFHMPLFIAVSGYLFWYSVNKYGVLKSIKKRIKRLLPVCFSWAIIICFMNLTKGEFIGIKHLIYYFLTNFWFLWAIIFSTICVAFIEIIYNKYEGGGYAIVGIVILFVVFILTPDVLWLHAHKFVAPYFIAGYYYAKKQKSWLMSNAIGNISVILWVFMMLFYSKDSYIYTTGITILRKENILNQLSIDVYRYLVGTVGVIAVIWISKKIYTFIVLRKELFVISCRKIVEYMGRNSITYYILSNYLFLLIMPKITENFTFNVISLLAETFVVVILCDMVGRVIKKFKFLSRILIGN